MCARHPRPASSLEYHEWTVGWEVRVTEARRMVGKVRCGSTLETHQTAKGKTPAEIRRRFLLASNRQQLDQGKISAVGRGVVAVSGGSIG